MTSVHPPIMLDLIERLRTRGVELDGGEIAHGCAIIADVTRGPGPFAVAPLPRLLDLRTDEIWSLAERRAILFASQQVLGDATREVSSLVAGELAVLIRDQLDDVLDQLRGDFAAAAATVTAAVEVGIQPGCTAEGVLRLGPDAVRPWQELAAALPVLDGIGQLRIDLTDLVDAAPAPDPFNFDRRAYGCCFTPVGEWSVGRHEPSRDRWLRLSQAGPVRLLAVAETEAAATAQRRIPPVPLTRDFDEDF